MISPVMGSEAPSNAAASQSRREKVPAKEPTWSEMMVWKLLVWPVGSKM